MSDNRTEFQNTMPNTERIMPSVEQTSPIKPFTEDLPVIPTIQEVPGPRLEMLAYGNISRFQIESWGILEAYVDGNPARRAALAASYPVAKANRDAFYQIAENEGVFFNFRREAERHLASYGRGQIDKTALQNALTSSARRYEEAYKNNAPSNVPGLGVTTYRDAFSGIVDAAAESILMDIDAGRVLNTATSTAQERQNALDKQDAFSFFRLSNPQLLNDAVARELMPDRNANLREFGGTFEDFIRRLDRQDLYTRWQPGQEPEWYLRASKEEKEVYDAELALARISYIKNILANQPDKFLGAIEGEAPFFGHKEIARMYESIPGFRQMSELIANAIVNKTTVDVGGGVMKDILSTTTPQEAYQFFARLADDTFAREGLLVKDPAGNWVHANIRAGELELAKTRAKADAWNLSWVSLLAESVDSRYAYIKQNGALRALNNERHDRLPNEVCPDEWRAVFHPQEKAETKWESEHFGWGPHHEWGGQQIRRLKGALRTKIAGFIPGKPHEYWTASGNVVKVPEAHPLKTTESFLEATKYGRGTMLEALLNRTEIDWNAAEGAPYGGYVASKFQKAIGLAEFYTKVPEKVGIIDYNWIRKYTELSESRLDQERFLREMRSAGIKTYQSVHNLLVWAVSAAYNGPSEPTSRIFLPRFQQEKAMLEKMFRQAGLLRSGFFGWGDETLDLEVPKAA